MKIGPAEVVALVGRMDRGKTTVARSWRLHMPQEGCSTWDGRTWPRWRSPRCASGGGAVPGFRSLFLSSRENIAIGRWERSDDEAAVRTAGPLRRVKVPESFPAATTPISVRSSSEVATSPRGSGSGALARAFFRDAELTSLTNSPPPSTAGRG